MIIALFCFTLSVGCFWFSIKFMSMYFKVKKWDTITAKIISKKIEIHKKISTSRSPYAVKVDYTYIFKDHEYQNSTVYITELLGGQTNHMESSAQKVIDNLPEKTPIYVNPYNPKQSVIFCDGLWLYIIVFIMALIAFLIGLSNFIDSIAHFFRM